MIYFTADTHFLDAHLKHDLHFAHRDFLTTAEMDQTIIENWNRVVTPQDTVYHLGDIAKIDSNRKGYSAVLDLLVQLNGQIVFVKGNHDPRALLKHLAKHQVKTESGQDKFIFHDVGLILKFDHYQFFLTHYPLMLGISVNSINLHGHIHHYAINSVSNLNVGVDSPEADYLGLAKRPFGQPFSQKEVVAMVQSKKIDFQKRK
ncbi:phosphoesterase [Ligilactobacillus salitolerans]|uniref:Phosphoesterase n=1 Tax=Ligilactobacillus salitolerans TaxID=1808352 RepID=A0A401IT35_9LACO|nr:metallophosphoesterase [Ligilactobacillus salitolerans]GBG94667.1 phosphoesterase [Ligilactobacillus salitolerans]